MKIETFKYCRAEDRSQRSVSRNPLSQIKSTFLHINMPDQCLCDTRSMSKWFVAIVAQAGRTDNRQIGLKAVANCGICILQEYAKCVVSPEIIPQRIVEEWKYSIENVLQEQRINNFLRFAPESFLAVAGNSDEIIILQYGKGDIYSVENATPFPMKPSFELKRVAKGFGENNIYFKIVKKPIPDSVLLFTGYQVSIQQVREIVFDFHYKSEIEKKLSAITAKESLQRKFEAMDNYGDEYCAAGYWISDETSASQHHGDLGYFSNNFGSTDQYKMPKRDFKADSLVQKHQNVDYSTNVHSNNGNYRDVQKSNVDQNSRAYSQAFKELEAKRQELDALKQELKIAEKQHIQLSDQLGYVDQKHQKKMEGLENARKWIDGVASRNPNHKRDSSQI
jgi:hypothetical protein